MKLNHRLLLVLIIVFAPLMVASGTMADLSPPNIVLFLIDDLGWKDCGFMGNPYVRTPHVDRLSNEGMVFTNAYSNGPNCASTRVSQAIT